MRRLRHAPTAVVAVLALALVIAAIVVPGSPAAEVRLHDGSVWVTSSQLGRVGRLSHQIDRFTTTVRQNNADHEVLQDGSNVALLDLKANQLTQLDPALGTMGQPVFVPANATVALGRDTVAIVNPTNGRMWARPLAQIPSLDTLRARADVDLGPGATATVTTSGQAIGLSVERAEVVRPGSDAGPVHVPVAMRPGDGVQVSAVGDRAVVVNQATRQLWVEGSDSALSLPEVDRLQLQEPSSQEDAASVPRTGLWPGRTTLDVVFATATGLYAVAGSSVVPLGARGPQGQPSRPVVVGGCVWGAFLGGNPRAVSACAQGAPTAAPIPSVATDARLELRRNRDVAVLNDTRSGAVWMLDKGMKLITQWEPAIEPVPADGLGANRPREEAVQPRRSQDNRPPVAKDDQLAVRAGRTTAIPVLDNDTDPDGDILTVQDPPELAVGTLGLVRGGTALQLAVPSDATGDLSFTYTVADGRGGKASANVRVRVLPADPAQANQAPVRRPRHDQPLDIASGGRETRRVLLDWVDPDGDDLILVGATAPGDDEVVFTPDGTLTFTDVGNAPGRKEIEVQVSDGVAVTRGTIVVNSRKQDEVVPVANGDFVSAAVDQEVVVRPMLNDVGERLTLAAVQLERGNGATVSPDYSGGSFTFRASRPGTHYVAYTISNGPRATGLVRVDVAEATVANRPPVAARDVALLPAGGSIQVDPLLNDEDPDGDVLVLQSVGESPELKVEMRQRRGLQITALTTPRRPVSLPYTVSDGKNQTSGTIIVMPAPPVADPRPLAVGDEVVVRAGDSTSVDVLANDTSPAGANLSLDKELAEQPSPAYAWTDGHNVRFTAPRVPGEYRAVYRVSDDLGQQASAQVRFVVVDDKVENTPPQPKKVEGRVLGGSRGRILIPLQGIDPQGDAVRLLGLDSAPRLGRVVGVTEQWLEYEAYPDSAGTDSFTYAVTDARGARATGEVRVGDVPRDAGNAAPTTTDDHVTARPGRTIRVPVLANDTDGDGDRFGFTDSQLTIDRAPDARVDLDSIALTVPEGPPVQGAYRVIDSRGAESSGTLVVTPDPNAPLQAPVARDDVVGAEQVALQDVIDVPVLRNDVDPDGDIRAAQVRVPAYEGDAGLRAEAVGSSVRVRVGPRMQQVRYEVVDTDGLVSSGMITVPGRADSVPARRPDVKDPVVTAGEPFDIDVAGYVIGTGGRDVSLVSEKRVWAAHGDVEVLDLGRLRYRPHSTYAGPSAVTFEVTDGANSSDPDGRHAVITLPTTVLPRPKPGEQKGPDAARMNHPPLAQPIELRVGAGEGPKTVDLTKLVTDPDKDAVTFTKPSGEVPSGVRVDLDGPRITAAADLTTRPGTVVKLRGEAMDDRGGRAEVVINVVVVASARSRARAVDDVVPGAAQGRPAVVAVLANDQNPFPERGPLVLTSAVVESGRGTAAMDGDKVVVTPAPDYVGQLVVRYQVEDATKTPERRAEGRVRLTVRGKPGRPKVPRALEVGDQRAVLQWTAAEDNGARITRYTVRGTGDGRTVTQDCPSTTCTIGGLQNNVTYTFTVTATNELGESVPSGTSGGVRPDVRPDAPAAPRPRFGDRNIALDWDAARSRGSAVTRYEVQVDGSGGGSTRPTNGTSLTWPNLANGQAYRFRVRAYNQAARPSDWSPWSRPETPAAPPSAPSEVGAVDTRTALGQEFDVSWKAPARTNGDAVRSYQVLDGSRVVATVQGGATKARVTLRLGQSYRFTVVAENKAGRSAPSAPSDEVRPYGAPDKPAAPRIVDELGGVRAAAPFSTRTNGAPVTRWWVQVNDRDPVAATDTTWSGATPTGAVTVRIKACASARCSAWSDPSAPVTVLARPGTPQVAPARDGVGRAAVSWRPGTTGGAPVTAAVVEVDGREEANQPATGSRTAPAAIQARLTVRVRVTNGRHWSDWSQPVTVQNPAPVIDASRGAAVGGGRTQVKASGAHLFGLGRITCRALQGTQEVGRQDITLDPQQGRFDGVVVGAAASGAADVRVVCDRYQSSAW